MKVFVTGHSHSRAIIDAVDNLRRIDPNYSHQVEYLLMLDPEYAPWRTWVNGEVQFNVHLVRSIEQKLTQLNPDIVVVTFEGAMHFIHGFLNHAKPFDFYEKNTEPEPGVDLVPYALVRMFYAHDVTQILKILIPMKLVAPASNFFYVAPPPPLEDELEILPFLAEDFEEIRDLGVAHPEFRLKMWRLYVDVLEQATASYGVQFLSAPATTLTPAGYLKPQFYADCLHANALYAIEVLAQIEQAQFEGAR